MLLSKFSTFAIEITQNENTMIAKIVPKLISFNFIPRIIQIVTKIKLSSIADFDTHRLENKIVEVQTEPKNEPMVEKNKSFQIFSQAFSHSKISDNKGIV
ncbi:MAG: hypothetical protein LBU14_02605 [Candidatus Peribacteria bacterium]|jgi:hypothetical protein|nr:hypothetical protein [Candidatus Peribacteria bacterium]